LKTYLAGASAVALIAAAYPAFAALPADSAVADKAEVAEDEAATITVTGLRTIVTSDAGTKTNTPLIETPQSITRIDNAELVRRNALSINQALTYVAGVTPNQRGGVVGRYDQLTIRGFAPAQFLDGMRLLGGSYSSPQIDFHRIESVDVIKGPASVLYGNATPGGLVNLTSKLPTEDFHGMIDLAAGSYSLWRGAVDVGGSLDADHKLRVRLIGGAERSDGFVDTTRYRRYYINPAISFAPNDKTSLSVIAAYQRDPKSGSYGSAPPIGTALPNPLGQLPVSFYDGEPSYEAFDRKQYTITGLFRRSITDWLKYRANTRYLKIKQHYRQVYGSSLSTDNRTLVRGGGGSDENANTWSFDNNLLATFGTGPLKHELMAGLDYYRSRAVGYQRFVTGAANGIPNLDIFNPVYGVAIPDIVASAVPTYTRRKQTGVYAQDQIQLGGLNLIGSIRKDWYRQTTTTAGVATRVGQDKVTYRAGALYAFDFGLSPYVSYSTSFEPQSGVNLAGQPYVPITGRQYEAGLKFQPRGTQTILTLSVYDLARQNVLVTDPANIRNSIQVGETKTRGVEAEGRGSIRPGLDFSVALTYMDARYTKGNPATAGVINGAAQSGVTGTRVLGVPKWMASSFLSYDLAKASAVSGPLAGLSFGGGVRYVGASDGLNSITAAGITTLNRFPVRGFTLVDTMLNYDLGAGGGALKGLNLALNVSNLFDKRHVSSCFATGWCWFGSPRTVVGSVRYKW
jgi:iron complex outermembrane receptor protein